MDDLACLSSMLDSRGAGHHLRRSSSAYPNSCSPGKLDDVAREISYICGMTVVDSLAETAVPSPISNR